MKQLDFGKPRMLFKLDPLARLFPIGGEGKQISKNHTMEQGNLPKLYSSELPLLNFYPNIVGKEMKSQKATQKNADQSEQTDHSKADSVDDRSFQRKRRDKSATSPVSVMIHDE